MIARLQTLKCHFMVHGTDGDNPMCIPKAIAFMNGLQSEAEDSGSWQTRATVVSEPDHGEEGSGHHLTFELSPGWNVDLTNQKR